MGVVMASGRVGPIGREVFSLYPQKTILILTPLMPSLLLQSYPPCLPLCLFSSRWRSAAVHGGLGDLQSVIVESRLHGSLDLLEDLHLQLVFDVLPVAALLPPSLAAVGLQGEEGDAYWGGREDRTRLGEMRGRGTKGELLELLQGSAEFERTELFARVSHNKN
jgi:hypothetical protein